MPWVRPLPLLTAVLSVFLLAGPAAGEESVVFDWEKERQHWAYQPLKEKSEWKTASDSPWPRQALDHFVLRRMTEEDLKPATPADAAALIRRLTFDLTGLPPTFEQVQHFSEAEDPEAAYEIAVERLLGSAQFGERMASLWLPVARYAEDQAHQVGNNANFFYPNAWLYRQWVVDAFNHDLPYDRFVHLQLAADSPEIDGENDLVALGFLGLGPKYYNRGRIDVLAEEWEDRVDTVTRGLLGMTVACARCHDHKTEAITMKDYYGLAGIFASTKMENKPLPGVKAEVDKKGKKKKIPPNKTIHVVKDGDVKDLELFERGDPNSKGPAVPRRFPQVLCESEPEPFTHGSGRLDLARAITGPARGLTARVFVNRVWDLFIGQPLVSTPSNFGKSGTAPTHSELLDFLAADFIDQSWSVKHLVRQILLSATYRQSADTTAEQLNSDPGNTYLARMNRRRLTAEMLRDSLLHVAGELEPTGGPSLKLNDPKNFRRTLYGRVSRKELDAYLAQFDYPDANVHCAVRSKTTTPAQKLFLLNSEFVLARAEHLSEQVASSLSSQRKNRIDHTYRSVLSRRPDAREVDLAESFLTQHGKPDRDRWIQLTQALLASNEFHYRD